MSHSTSRHWVIIPAAGIGSRMAADRPKQYLDVSGVPIIEHTLNVFLSNPLFSGILVGLARDDAYWQALPASKSENIITYSGGAERAETVLKGLETLRTLAHDDDWVWVHDAARPGLDSALIEALRTSLDAGVSGAMLAIPVADTLKREGKDRHVGETVDRAGLWRAQTPQVFRIGQLRAALEYCRDNNVVVTDESSAMELKGLPPVLVEGNDRNLKVTRPADLEQLVAQTENGVQGQAGNIKGSDSSVKIRIGSGYDVHAFEPGDKIVLGGVEISHTQGIRAHSDGDVLLHALADALLGSLALGDIGHHFPDTDPEWKGASSRVLLRAVADLLRKSGYQTVNADMTIMAQAPRMAPHISAMREKIASDLGIPVASVSVKATTTEALGFVGRKEGIACQATVLVAAL